VRIIKAIFILLVFLPSCREKKPVFSSFTGVTQGTTYSMVFENTGNIATGKLQAEVEKILHDFDMSLSVYQDSSTVSRINRNERISVDSFFLDAFSKAQNVSAMTDGAFDVTVGPLVKAWGFGPDARKSFTEAKRDSLVKLVGMEKIEVINNKVIKSDPGIILDFNAIAQGYSVDVIYGFFEKLGISNFLVEIGGEVRVKGDRDGNYWRIGIDRPDDNNMIPGNNLQAIIRIKDRALATSGNYRKFFVENGIKYSHTIDPRTGYPVKNQLLSATIITDDCAIADGIATACMVMGKDEAIRFILDNPQFEAYLIFSDASGNFKTWISESLKAYISESED
jgi:thiamine biosynthesis lipoprotein